MKSRRSLAFVAALACAALPALGAPPHGHLTPEQAREMLMPDKPASAAELPHEGTVVAVIDADQFTYIEVDRDGRREWLAAPLMAVKAGARIRYEDGAVMANFHSKLLQRTFPSVMFVGQVVVTAQP